MGLYCLPIWSYWCRWKCPRCPAPTLISDIRNLSRPLFSRVEWGWKFRLFVPELDGSHITYLTMVLTLENWYKLFKRTFLLNLLPYPKHLPTVQFNYSLSQSIKASKLLILDIVKYVRLLSWRANGNLIVVLLVNNSYFLHIKGNLAIFQM